MTSLGATQRTQDLEQVAAAWPTGIVIPTALTVEPTGFLFCRGQLVSTSTYAALFALLSHRFNGGTDPGGGQFRLPDLRQRSPMGRSSSVLSGVTGGTKAHTHGANTMKHEHYHVAGSLYAANHGHYHSCSAGDHTHGTAETQKAVGNRGGGGSIRRNFGGATQGASTGALGGGIGGSGNIGVGGNTDWGSADQITGSTGAADPPYLATNFLIKT